MRKFCSRCISFLFYVWTIFHASLVYAEGFYIDPQSAEGMGVSQAGIPTGYRDGSSSFYNPAALVLHSSSQVSFQGHYLHANARFKDEGSSVLGVPNRGSSDNDGGREAFFPTTYGVIPLTSSVVLGGFINTPFGLGTKYSNDWVGRYQNVETEMRTVNVGGSLGVELGSGLSVGGGLSALYADVLLSTAIDFGAITALTAGPEVANSLGISPQNADGAVRIRASDWGLGWNLGALYRFGEQDKYRVGISYRGPTEINFHGGSVDYTVPSSVSGILPPGAFTSTQARSSITLPESLSLGTRIPITESIVFLQQSTWTRWSRAQNISISFENTAQPPIREELEWNDSWLHSVGLLFNVTSQFDISLGGAYEDGVVPSARRRSPRLPTSDGVWATLGAGYRLPDSKVQLNVAYARLDFRGGAADSSGPTGDRMVGSWDSLNQALSFSATTWW